MKKIDLSRYPALRFAGEILRLYSDMHIPRSAAAMSYHLTMTFFPLIICLYALFGQDYSTALRLLDYFRRFLTPDAIEMIEKYLLYLSNESGTAITVIAVTFLATSASAAMRVLIGTVNGIQGKSRFGRVGNYISGYVLAVGLLIAFYSAFIVLLMSDSAMASVSRHIPWLGGVTDWSWVRFLLLGALAFAALWILFHLFRPRGERFRVFPGVCVAAVGIVAMSWVFSEFIAASARYELVYGSLATIILMMFWIYLICMMIFIGACVNAAGRNARARGEGTAAGAR